MAKEEQQDNLLQRLRKGLRKTGLIGKTKEAANWLMGLAQRALTNRTSIQRRILSKKEQRRNQVFLGNMYFYVYDAKWKAKLPYFDKFPLVIPIEMYSDGFLGLNLHYLIPPQRAILLNRMTGYLTNQSYDETTRIKLSYQTVKNASKLGIAKPAIKRYLYSHVRSQFIYVPSSEWDIAIFLPAENWSNGKGNR